MDASFTKNEDKVTFSLGDVEETKDKIEEVDSMNSLAGPVICPVESCKKPITSNCFLSHFLNHHEQNFPPDFVSIKEDNRAVLVFDLSLLTFEQSVCIGILAHEGKKSDGDKRSPILGPERRNSFLPAKFRKYIDHLPVVIHICYTTLYSFIAKKPGNVTQLPPPCDPTDESKRIIVIWLMTVNTLRPVYCTVTAFDRQMTHSRSSLFEVRNLQSSQDPKEFLSEDCNYMMLRKAEMESLSQNGNDPIHFDICIHENM